MVKHLKFLSFVFFGIFFIFSSSYSVNWIKITNEGEIETWKTQCFYWIDAPEISDDTKGWVDPTLLNLKLDW